MKKLLLASLALALLASCAKDDQGGIPPVMVRDRQTKISSL